MKKVVARSISAVLTLCAVWGWWGALYPEFTLLRGTYSIVSEDASVPNETNMIESETDSRELYWEILGADPSRIRFKSRLLTEWSALQEAEE